MMASSFEEGISKFKTKMPRLKARPVKKILISLTMGNGQLMRIVSSLKLATPLAKTGKRLQIMLKLETISRFVFIGTISANRCHKKIRLQHILN